MRLLFLVSIALFLSACSDNNEPQKVSGEHVWKEQTDMINKAKNVQNILNNAALEQQKNIEKQTQN